MRYELYAPAIECARVDAAHRYWFREPAAARRRRHRINARRYIYAKQFLPVIFDIRYTHYVERRIFRRHALARWRCYAIIS